MREAMFASQDNGIAFILPNEPPIGVWTTNHLTLDEQAGWLWMNDDTPMENLPQATRAQIA
jgi:hypothetical protein